MWTLFQIQNRWDTDTQREGAGGGEAVIAVCVKYSCTIVNMCILFKIPTIDERKEEACDLQLANQWERMLLWEKREQQQQQQLQWNPNIQTEVQVVLLPMIQRQRETEWDIQVKAKRVRPTTTAIKSKHPNRSSGRHFATIQRERDVLV